MAEFIVGLLFSLIGACFAYNNCCLIYGIHCSAMHHGKCHLPYYRKLTLHEINANC